MLSSAIIIIWSTLGGWILKLIPNYNLPSESINTIDYFLQIISPWDVIIPMSEMLTVIIIILTIEIGLTAARLFIGIIALVRGSGKPEI